MAKKLCIVAAPQDEKAVAMMKRHMVMMMRNGLFSLVEDIESANVVAIMMSNDMLVDDRAYSMSESAKRKRAAGACHVVPVLVEPMAEVPDHLVMLQFIPRNGNPARTDEQWAEVAGELRALAMKDAA